MNQTNPIPSPKAFEAMLGALLEVTKEPPDGWSIADAHRLMLRCGDAIALAEVELQGEKAYCAGNVQTNSLLESLEHINRLLDICNRWEPDHSSGKDRSHLSKASEFLKRERKVQHSTPSDAKDSDSKLQTANAATVPSCKPISEKPESAPKSTDAARSLRANDQSVRLQHGNAPVPVDTAPTFGIDGLCECSCADLCPLGKIGSAPRCTKREIELQDAKAPECGEGCGCGMSYCKTCWPDAKAVVPEPWLNDKYALSAGTTSTDAKHDPLLSASNAEHIAMAEPLSTDAQESLGAKDQDGHLEHESSDREDAFLPPAVDTKAAREKSLDALTTESERLGLYGGKDEPPEPWALGWLGKDKPNEATKLTQEQRHVLQEINDFLLQFSDRDKMQAGAYLTKYKNMKTCEETCVSLRWSLQREFNNVG